MCNKGTCVSMAGMQEGFGLQASGLEPGVRSPEPTLNVVEAFAERHGNVLPLFDKGDWLHPRRLDQDALAARREKRDQELRTWFAVSQSFVRKVIRRGQHAEAVSAFWSYTMKPLAELLRMRYCPVRWDFGMRYLDRDLPPDVYAKVRDLVFVQNLEDLEATLVTATAWGTALIQELDSA